MAAVLMSSRSAAFCVSATLLSLVPLMGSTLEALLFLAGPPPSAACAPMRGTRARLIATSSDDGIRSTVRMDSLLFRTDGRDGKVVHAGCWLGAPLQRVFLAGACRLGAVAQIQRRDADRRQQHQGSQATHHHGRGRVD